MVEAFKTTVRNEGIIPALESAHGIAGALKEASQLQKEDKVLITLSGRGDKDIFTIADALQDPAWKEFIKHKASSY